MDYDWDGARWHQKKQVGFGAAEAFTGLVIALVTQLVIETL
ncbi:hypothetical protein [Ensifer sp. 4252]